MTQLSDWLRSKIDDACEIDFRDADWEADDLKLRLNNALDPRIQEALQIEVTDGGFAEFTYEGYHWFLFYYEYGMWRIYYEPCDYSFDVCMRPVHDVSDLHQVETEVNQPSKYFRGVVSKPTLASVYSSIELQHRLLHALGDDVAKERRKEQFKLREPWPAFHR